MKYKVKYILFILLYLFLPIIYSYGQKNIEIPPNPADTSYFNNRLSFSDIFELEDLTKTKDTLRIRIFLDTEIIDITRTDTTSIKLTTYLIPVNESDKIIYETHYYQDQFSKELLERLISMNILTLPDDSESGLDGNNFRVEISTESKYRIYSYWNPTISYENLYISQAAKIIEFLNKSLDTQSHQNNLIMKIGRDSHGYYKGEGSHIIINTMKK